MFFPLILLACIAIIHINQILHSLTTISLLLSSIGPRGSAICVYPADRMAANENGIFDVFLGDVAISNPTGPNDERQNTFTECAPQGRDMNGEAEDVQIIKDISQLGNNPLVILDGVQ